MNMTEWAKNEIKFACEREKGLDTDGDFDYGVGCYESAYKAFCSLMEDGHSGFSIGITKNILDRLIEGKPLTPIIDIPEIWVDVTFEDNNYKTYQCTRMTSLFKYVYYDGTVKYNDVSRAIGININNPTCTFTSGLVSEIVNKLFPINLPYCPSGRYEVYTEDFLVDSKNGDFDTVGVFYLITPDKKKIDLNKFYHYIGNERIEISKEEYQTLKDISQIRML